MAPKVNIKRFSRSKIDEIVEEVNNIQPIKIIKNKKQVRILEEPEIEPDVILEEQEQEIEPEYYNYNPEEEDNFLEELNNSNYKEEIKDKDKKKEK